MKEKENKLVLHNVIGGLEKKEIPIKEDFKGLSEFDYTTKTIKAGEHNGHNQLCNRGVEYKEELKKHFIRLARRYGNEDVTLDNFEEEMPCSMLHCYEAISKAISQGKVIKVKE